MKSEEFHKPFVKSLVLVVLVTIGSMIFSHYIVDYYMGQSLKSPIFTSSQSHYTNHKPE